MIKELLIEAVVVGVIVVIVGTLVAFSLRLFYPYKVELPKQCKQWNKYFVMEMCLFLTGFVAHILCEFSGLNKWYCKNGVACSKR